MNHRYPHNISARGRWKLAGIGAAIASVLTLGACSHAEHSWHHDRSYFESDPDKASARIDKMVGWVLDDVNANSEQKQKVAAIAKSAMQDLLPLRDQHRAARGQAIELLSQPQLDRDAIEALRAEELRLVETASRRITQALTETAEVLTPEQRAKLAEHWKKRMT